MKEGCRVDVKAPPLASTIDHHGVGPEANWRSTALHVRQPSRVSRPHHALPFGSRPDLNAATSGVVTGLAVAWKNPTCDPTIALQRAASLCKPVGETCRMTR